MADAPAEPSYPGVAEAAEQPAEPEPQSTAEASPAVAQRRTESAELWVKRKTEVLALVPVHLSVLESLGAWVLFNLPFAVPIFALALAFIFALAFAALVALATSASIRPAHPDPTEFMD
jgi:hypothetical protein